MASLPGRIGAWIISLACGALLAFWPLIGCAEQSGASQGPVRVVGRDLISNGQIFLVKGLQIVAFEVPDALLSREPRRLSARQNFGPRLLNAAKQWGANTIRFQLSPQALDPNSSLYSASYVSEIRSAISLARSAGFVVIADIQAQNKIVARANGQGEPEEMPDALTTRSDVQLATLFGSDLGIILEPFNEPALRPSPENWHLWRDGGTVDDQTVVGFQTIIDEIRHAGAHNVIAVDGMMFAKSFEGAPTLTDPLDQLVYAVHPYLPNNGSPALWQSRFGFLADEGKPVVATEWNAQTGGPPNAHQWCAHADADITSTLMNFLAAKRIGIVGHAFDLPGSIVQDFNGTPTNYLGKHCGDPDGGPGELLRAQFQHIH